VTFCNTSSGNIQCGMLHLISYLNKIMHIGFLVNLCSNKVDETISFFYEVRWCVHQFHSDSRAPELHLHLYFNVLLALLISGLSGKNVTFRTPRYVMLAWRLNFLVAKFSHHFRYKFPVLITGSEMDWFVISSHLSHCSGLHKSVWYSKWFFFLHYLSIWFFGLVIISEVMWY